MSLGKFTTAVAAAFVSGAGTFDLTAGETLDILVDGPNQVIEPTYDPIYGGDLVEVTFEASQFANIAAATAAEVAAAINAAALAQAAAGEPPALVATVTSSTHVTVTAVGSQASNRGLGPSLQVLSQSTALTALSVTAGIYNPSGFPGVGAMPSAPVFFDFLTFAGDGAYPSGGSLGFGAAVQAYFGDGRKVLAVIGQDCGGYVPVYVPATDALKVYTTGSADHAPLDENTTSNLSGTTFNVLVISA